MAKAHESSSSFVWVKDRAGNEFICPANALKDPRKASRDELSNCIDDASAGVNIGD